VREVTNIQDKYGGVKRRLYLLLAGFLLSQII
jgi:hypothetical protein